MAVRITRTGLGLTVGIIVLALVVLGGLYLAKERGEQARRADALEVAQQTLDAQSGTGALTPSIDGETEQSGTATEGSGAANGSTEESTAGSNGTGQSATSQAEQDTKPAGNTAQSSPSQLPQTGPVEGASIIAAALLAFSVASYTTSRQQLRKNLR